MRVSSVWWIAGWAAATACPAEWRTQTAPAGVQAMLDMDSVSASAGTQQMLIRREYLTLRATAQGEPFRSIRVNCDIDCASRRASATLTAWYGDGRHLIGSERHVRFPRASLATTAPGSDIAEGLTLACERLATVLVAPVDLPPVQRGDTSDVWRRRRGGRARHHQSACCTTIRHPGSQ